MNKKTNKRMDIILGLPLSGRKRGLGYDLEENHGSTLIDLEVVMSTCFDYCNSQQFMSFYREGCAITKETLEYYLQRGRDIVQTKTALTEIDVLRAITQAKDYGYTVYLHRMETPAFVALGHLLNRNMSDGTFYPPELLFHYAPGYQDPTGAIFENLKEHPDVKGYSHWLGVRDSGYRDSRDEEMWCDPDDKKAYDTLADTFDRCDGLIDRFNHAYFDQMDYALRCKLIHYVYDFYELPADLEELINWQDDTELLWELTDQEHDE